MLVERDRQTQGCIVDNLRIRFENEGKEYYVYTQEDVACRVTVQSPKLW